MTTATLPRSVQAALERLDSWKDDVMRDANNAAILEEVAAALAEDMHAYVDALTGPKLTIYVRHLRDVVPVLRELAQRGMHTQKDKPYEDSNYDGTREYTLVSKSCDMIAKLIVGLHEGAACKRVQVGVIERPVYELQCE